MTSPPATERRAERGSAIGALVSEARGDPLTLIAGIAAFLLGGVASWGALRVALWDGFKADLAGSADVTVVATTPFDVVLLQARVALLVGLLFAVQAVLYRSRRALPLRRWFGAGGLPGPVRATLVVVALAAFPVGAVLGYDFVFPAVVETVAAGDASWSIVRWAGLASYTAIATGLVAQLSVVAAAVGLSRLGGRGGESESVEY